ncbi:Hypothetical predicted protein [Cloeon dipterum]|uniref:C-type lectin domain-containing protein n=1 Tax=Cloeon dipterum TaxID=197152 RepID=A0A8S1C8J5_9INSE|nr:Hypothetical predicted protein [Cloeon dipterum]
MRRGLLMSTPIFTSLFASLAIADSAVSEAVSNISININAGSETPVHCNCISAGEFSNRAAELNDTLLAIKNDIVNEIKALADSLKELHRKIDATNQSVFSNADRQLEDAKNDVHLIVNAFITNKNFPKVLLSKFVSNWYEADRLCKRHGFQLISIQNATKAHEVWKFASTYSRSNIWTSGTDQSKTPGDFYWLTGTKVLEDLFQAGQPNGYGYDSDVCLTIYDGSLADFPCNDMYFFVCEDLRL